LVILFCILKLQFEVVVSNGCRAFFWVVVGAVCGHPSICGKLTRKGHTPLSLWEKNDVIHQEIYLFIYFFDWSIVYSPWFSCKFCKQDFMHKGGDQTQSIVRSEGGLLGTP